MPRFKWEIRNTAGAVVGIGSSDGPNAEQVRAKMEALGWTDVRVKLIEKGVSSHYIVTYDSLGPIDNNSYLIVDRATWEAALVDPSFGSEKILQDIVEKEYKLRYILNTHAHFDHIIGNAYFAEKTGAPIALHRDDLELLRALPEQGKLFDFEATPSPEPTIFLEEGQTLTLGETKIEVLFTPGHAPGHVTFIVGDTALVGDVLFKNSIGRTDLPGGSLKTLLHSIRTRLLTLPDTTQILPGHGHPTSIGRERQNNPHLQGLE